MSASVPAAISRRLRQEGGFSLIELLVVMSLFLFVMGAALSVMDTGGKAGPRDAERASAIREQQVGLYRMVRELRQAYRMVGSSKRSMEVLVRIARNGSHENRHVAYDCSEESPGKCIRKETTIGQPLPATGEVVIDRVLNWTAASQPVFDFPDDASGGVTPAYVTVRVEVPAAGERPDGFRNKLTLEDGFFARNVHIVGYQ
jgi:prepilin-type N-terminal cleavage/methylation domain-containing protein